MVDEQSQAEPQPEAEATEPQSTEESQAVDYAALEKDIAGLGDGYTLSTIKGKTSDLIKGMNDAQTGFSQYKARMSNMDPVVEFMERDPGYRDHLRKATEEYLDGKSGTADTFAGTPAPTPQAFDPMAQRITQVETELYSQLINNEIDKISKDYPVDDITRTKIWQKVEQTGSKEVLDHYFAIKGPELIHKARGEGAKEAVEGITAANKSYVPNQGAGSPPAEAFDAAKLSDSDLGEMIIDELKELGA